MPESAELAFRWTRLQDMGGPEVHALLMARAQVFVVEQQCPYLDPDPLDVDAWHLLAHAGDALVGCVRAVPPGLKYDEPSIGRVLVVEAFRGRGLAVALMREAIAGTQARWPGQGIRISAQAYLLRFYATLGFEQVGDAYDEDGIPHIEMLRPALP